MRRLTVDEQRNVVLGVVRLQKTDDLEASTFQKRPAYRYIRKSDHLPVEAPDNPLALVRLFDPMVHSSLRSRDTQRLGPSRWL